MFQPYFKFLFGTYANHLSFFMNSYKGRPYHSEKHIEKMLEYFEKYKNTLHEPTAVLLAILYHDIVYDSQAERGMNEKMSNWHLQSIRCDLGFNEQFVETAGKMILATIDHKSFSDDCNFFLDCDLSILSESTEDVQKYDDAIRQEYAWVTDDVYTEGRKNVLNKFLGRDTIYVSPAFVDRNEQAKENLRFLLKKYIK